MKIIGNTVGTPLPKSDWNQNDPSKGDYIKNKPFGEEASRKDLTGRKNVDLRYLMYDSQMGTGAQELVYVVDGVEYTLTGKITGYNDLTAYDTATLWYVGNLSLHPNYSQIMTNYPSAESDDVPFLFCIKALAQSWDYEWACERQIYGAETVSVYKETKTLTSLDEKFIPETIARVEDIPEVPEYVTVDQLPEELQFSITTTIDNYAAYNANFMGEVVAGLSDDSTGIVHEPYTLQTKKLNGSWSIGNRSQSTDEHARYVGNTAIAISDGRVTSNSGDSISNYPADDVPFLIVWNTSDMVCYTSDGSATMDFIRQVHTENVDPIDERIIPDTIARKDYVDTAVAGLVDSAPETLNTLNELAQALGDDANFATTVATQIGEKANSSDLAALRGLVGDTAVATQITNALVDYYTKAQIDAMEFITVADIDEICGATI